MHVHALSGRENIYVKVCMYWFILFLFSEGKKLVHIYLRMHIQSLLCV